MVRKDVTKTFFAIFCLMMSTLVNAEENIITFEMSLPESCFEKDSITQQQFTIAGVPGLSVSFKLLPACDCNILEAAVVGNIDETFTGIHSVWEDENVSDTLIFRKSKPTTIYAMPGKTSSIFLTMQGDKGMPEEDRKVHLTFVDSKPKRCLTVDS